LKFAFLYKISIRNPRKDHFHEPTLGINKKVTYDTLILLRRISHRQHIVFAQHAIEWRMAFRKRQIVMEVRE